MTTFDMPSDDGSSGSGGSGGDSPSSLGSLSSTATETPPNVVTAVVEATLGERVKAAREAKGLTNNQLDKAARIGQGTSKRIEDGDRKPGAAVMDRLSEALDLGLAPKPQPSTGGSPSEQRPSATGRPRKRGLLGRKPRGGGPADPPRPPPSRPSYKRVSTSPVTESFLTFLGGGLERMGQGPLGAIMGFTSPVAGEIVDDVIAGTLPDRVIQPFVRGSEKYQNLSALAACYGSVAWASNVPESAEQAYALFQWSMTVLLPLQGKQMVKRAKEHQKAAEAMAEVMPELIQMLGPDPIRGLWDRMWQQPQPQPEEAPAHA